VTVSGDKEAGATIVATVQIAGVTRNATSNGTRWSYTLTEADYANLGYGNNTFTATLTDWLGNTSSQTVDVFFDMPSINTVAGDNTISASEAASGVVLTGSAAADSTVTLSLGGNNGVPVVRSGTAWTYRLAAGGLPCHGRGRRSHHHHPARCRRQHHDQQPHGGGGHLGHRAGDRSGRR